MDEVEAYVGHPDGAVVDGEKIVYDFIDGHFAGWHKEAVSNG